LTVEGLQSNAKGLDADRGILKSASIAINGLTS